MNQELKDAFFEKLANALTKLAVDFSTLGRAASTVPHFKMNTPGMTGAFATSKNPILRGIHKVDPSRKIPAHLSGSIGGYKPGVYMPPKAKNTLPHMYARAGAAGRAMQSPKNVAKKNIASEKLLKGVDEISRKGTRISGAKTVLSGFKDSVGLARKIHKDSRRFDRFKTKSPEGKQAIHDATLLHEKREGRESRTKNSQFFSHHNTKPMLQDLNIASTYHGPDSQKVRQNIRAARSPEIAKLKKDIPGVNRLKLGKNRISRHAMRRLDDLHTKANK